MSDLTDPVAVAIAHPDDEVFCSGLICALRAMSFPVHLLCFTRGEGGDRGHLPAEAKLGEIREAEMKEAAAALDVTSLVFLDYHDPAPLGQRLKAPEVHSPVFREQLTSFLKETGAAHLFTHGSSGEYWHPAHLCLHRHLRQVTRALKLPCWGFNAWTPQHPLPQILNQDDVPNLTVDGAIHSEQRLASLQCHKTQIQVFERFCDGDLAKFIALTSTEKFSRI